MKRFFAMIPLLALVLAAFAVSVARAENAVDAYLRQHYADWETVSISRNGDAGAAILQKGDQSALVVIKGENVIDRTRDDGGRWGRSVTLDTDSVLFLSFGSDTDKDVYTFYYVLDQWLLGGAIKYQTANYEDASDIRNLTREYSCALLDDMVCLDQLLDDETDNILWRKILPSLPDVLTEEEMDLALWDPYTTPLTGIGYRNWRNEVTSASVCERLFDAMKRGTPYAAYVFADGLVREETVQFVADRPDGSRVLLCGSQEEGPDWQFVESVPLPAGTTIGIENFTGHLYLGQKNGHPYGASVQQFADGTWGIDYVLCSGADGMIFMGQNWLCQDGTPWFGQGMLIGDHPWRDITKIDWNTLPQTYEEALARLDTARWATPNNSNMQDRLNLRERADKSSGSLGKFYNGTPVEVLERGKEWTKVRVGTQTGYMMTKYLAFGEDMRKVNCPQEARFFAGVLADVYWQQDQTTRSGPESMPSDASPRFMFVGLADGDWWLVWDYEANRFGRIHADQLWEGNG